MAELMRFQHNGMECLVADGPCSINGYVAVDEKHPLYEVDYMDESESLGRYLAAMLEKPLPSDAGLGLMLSAMSGEILPTPENVLRVHGGITYSRKYSPCCDAPASGKWWFGFDTNHYVDTENPKSVEYVADQCRQLAEQLASLRP